MLSNTVQDPPHGATYLFNRFLSSATYGGGGGGGYVWP